jgi:hypothetical protein
VDGYGNVDGQFGPLTGLVGAVGSLFAAGGAILFTWRGRTRWDPPEEGIKEGPRKLAGLATAVLVAVLWGLTRGQSSVAVLAAIAIGLLALAVVTLLVYSYAMGSWTYEDTRRHRKLIAGFRLTPEAQQATAGQTNKVPDYLAAVDFNPKKVWSDRSRAVAIGLFAALYVALVVSGSLSLTAAAILVEKGSGAAEPTAAPTVTPLPTPAGPIVSVRTLRWVDAESGGAVLDGGVLTADKTVWLQELFPDSPPSGFQILESLDPVWPPDVQSAVAALRLPKFGLKPPSGHSVVSDSAWKLPRTLGAPGPRTFTFVDQNPDGTATQSGTIEVSSAVVAPAEGDASCPAPDGNAGVSVQVGQPGCAQFSVVAGADPTFDISLLTPWDQGDRSLLAAIGSWFRELEMQSARGSFDAQKALELFGEQHRDALPRSLPKGWEISTDVSSLTVGPGQSGHVALKVRADAAGSALVAIRLTDRATGEVILSPLIPVAVRGDAPPSVAILDPSTDLVGVSRLGYTGSDQNGWYTELKVSAAANDPEDGTLGEGAYAWSTDRTDLQGASLGSGSGLVVRLYSRSCEGGAIHTITVTVTDSAGATATASRQIEIGQLC